MSQVIKWASGCVIGLSLSTGVCAELIDSVRSGTSAYLISETHLYVYDSSTGLSSAIELDASPIAVDATTDGIFVAYSNKIEKRGFDGAILTDGSGSAIERNLHLAEDIIVHETTLYATFNEGDSLFELDVEDLSAINGAYINLDNPMKRLVAYPSSGAIEQLYSPDGKDLRFLPFPVTETDGKAVTDVHLLPTGVSGYVDTPEDVFLLEGATGEFVIMDNGVQWIVNPPAMAESYSGWIAGLSFRFLDQAEDDNWSVVRDKVVACEPTEDLTWASDLIHYDDGLSFDSRYKAGEPEELFEIVHLWGAGANPQAHLFRESEVGTLQVDATVRDDGEAFDDGHIGFSVTSDQSLSDYQTSQGGLARHVTFSDDGARAYVLHQGDERCQSAVRVYNLGSNTWESSIPLRWRADGIAVIGGSNPDSSDDWLGVVYETAYDVYGSSDVLASFIDLNGVTVEEDPASDFDDYGAFYFNLGLVEGSRHAVIFQVEVASQPDFSVLTGVGPNGGLDSYTHINSVSAAVEQIESWDARAELGEQATLVLRAEEDLSLLNFVEDAMNFDFDDTPVINAYLDDPSDDSLQAPLVASAGQEVIAIRLDETNSALFVPAGQAFSEGKPQDFLPSQLEAAVWSELDQAGSSFPALYNLNGGDMDGDTASSIQRWQLTLGADGHAHFIPAGEGTLAGLPVRADITDPATDDLMLTTIYQGQFSFTPVTSDLSDAPGHDGAGGGSDDSGGGSSGGGSGGGASSGSGFSRDSGGGSLFGLLLFIAFAGLRRVKHC